MAVTYLQLPYLSVVYFAEKLRKQSGFVWLDSAKTHSEMGRYSYLLWNPFAEIYAYPSWVYWQGQWHASDNALGFLEQVMQAYTIEPLPELPPFQGGAAGFFSYELNQQIEPSLITAPGHGHELSWPLLALGLYDVVLAFDHYTQRAWLIASDIAADTHQCHQDWASKRLQQARDELFPEQIELMTTVNNNASPALSRQAITSNFSQSGYQQAVQKIRDYILQGDTFEVNLSQRFECSLPENYCLFSLYCRLRRFNPAPFAAYVQLGPYVIASASPERFIKVQDKIVQTRPIKGTIARSDCQETDQANARALQSSEKDWAENTMIVDLLRNDLSRVCQPGTIEVPQLCGLETFETVHHLVSVVEGRLAPNYGPVSLLRSAFPGGSITGAPKVRAMEIIQELEPHPRGPYCGSIGFIGFDGTMDSSIVIRTMACHGQSLTFHAGGAVVLDSDPRQEHEETLTKAQALLTALTTVDKA